MEIKDIPQGSDEEFLRGFETAMSIPDEPETQESPSKESEVEVPLVPETEVPAAEETPQLTESSEGETPALEVPAEGVVSGTETEQPATEEPKTEEPAKELGQEAQYKDFYAQVMAPFKAGGKTIQLSSPAEALELMKKGVDYTRKTQELASERKFLVMLDKHNLKDEAKLGFLIDLNNKNPEAIKQLIKDSGMDPLDIDTQAAPNYVPGNHSIADAEIAFSDVIKEVNSSPEGQGVVQTVFNSWDQASQGHMWKDPETLRILTSQKQSGIFDIVEGEIEKRKLLGQLPAGIPHLEAYRIVGTELGSQGKFAHLVPAATEVPTPTPIATRAATTKPAVKSNPAVKAAATRVSTASSNTDLTLDRIAKLSDEEYLKLFNK